jgi:recombination protein RecA
MAAAPDLEALLSQLGGKLRFAASEPSRALRLDWPDLDAVLPDGGLPRGVVELAARHGLGGGTSVALAAVKAGQARSKGAWCAWIDPEGTLHAPGVVAAGVDLARMLVVRAPRSLLARVAVKVVASGAFEVVVVDADAIAGVGPERTPGGERMARKLALAAEPSGATVLLLTDATRPRAAPWPVALRLELSRSDARTLAVRIAKDRRGRPSAAHAVPFWPVTRFVDHSAAVG